MKIKVKIKTQCKCNSHHKFIIWFCTHTAKFIAVKECKGMHCNSLHLKFTTYRILKIVILCCIRSKIGIKWMRYTIACDLLFELSTSLTLYKHYGHRNIPFLVYVLRATEYYCTLNAEYNITIIINALLNLKFNTKLVDKNHK